MRATLWWREGSWECRINRLASGPVANLYRNCATNAAGEVSEWRYKINVRLVLGQDTPPPEIRFKSAPQFVLGLVQSGRTPGQEIMQARNLRRTPISSLRLVVGHRGISPRKRVVQSPQARPRIFSVRARCSVLAHIRHMLGSLPSDATTNDCGSNVATRVRIGRPELQPGSSPCVGKLSQCDWGPPDNYGTEQRSRVVQLRNGIL